MIHLRTLRRGRLAQFTRRGGRKRSELTSVKNWIADCWITPDDAKGGMVAAATPQRVGPASAGRLRQLGICAFVGRTGISARPNALELAEALNTGPAPFL